MTPQEQIAYLRDTYKDVPEREHVAAVFAVCDLAERALLSEPLEALLAAGEAVHNAMLHLADQEADHECPDEGCWAWEAADEKYRAAYRAYVEVKP